MKGLKNMLERACFNNLGIILFQIYKHKPRFYFIDCYNNSSEITVLYRVLTAASRTSLPH